MIISVVILAVPIVFGIVAHSVRTTAAMGPLFWLWECCRCFLSRCCSGQLIFQPMLEANPTHLRRDGIRTIGSRRCWTQALRRIECWTERRRVRAAVRGTRSERSVGVWSVKAGAGDPHARLGTTPRSGDSFVRRRPPCVEWPRGRSRLRYVTGWEWWQRQDTLACLGAFSSTCPTVERKHLLPEHPSGRQHLVRRDAFDKFA